jgi:hypothetical protein
LIGARRGITRPSWYGCLIESRLSSRSATSQSIPLAASAPPSAPSAPPTPSPFASATAAEIRDSAATTAGARFGMLAAPACASASAARSGSSCAIRSVVAAPPAALCGICTRSDRSDSELDGPSPRNFSTSARIHPRPVHPGADAPTRRAAPGLPGRTCGRRVRTAASRPPHRSGAHAAR